MGLDMSHDAWHGAYSAFAGFRNTIAEIINFNEYPEITDISDPRFEKIKSDPLYYLLAHSDCDGGLTWEQCGAIADRLEELLPEFENRGEGGGHIGYYKDKAQTMIDGMRAAYNAKEALEFM